MLATPDVIKRVNTGKTDYTGEPITLFWDERFQELSDYAQTHYNLSTLTRWHKTIYSYEAVINACGFTIKENEIVAPACDEQTVHLFTELMRQLYWGTLTDLHAAHKQHLQR